MSSLSFLNDKPKLYWWMITTKRSVTTNLYHDIIRLGRSDGASHLENHASQQPEQSSDAELYLVDGRDAHVHMAHRRVGVTTSNHINAEGIKGKEKGTRSYHSYS
jgi:hypothetical protein